MKSIYFFVKRLYELYVALVRRYYKFEHIVVLVPENDDVDRESIDSELSFYVGANQPWRARTRIPLPTRILYLMRGDPVVTIGISYKQWHRLWLNEFNVDANKCHVAAWSWHQLSTFVNREFVSREIDDKKSFEKLMTAMKCKTAVKKAYVFGTGPSLIKCFQWQYSDGIRIACNTMVKSDRIWNHIKPNILVAGDAIHHFSNTDYANNFRRDLRKRLSDNPDLLFLYPSDFHFFVSRHLSEYRNQLIPMGSNGNTDPFKNFNGRLTRASNENVLTMLQLPLAANFAREIYFLGYDGRASGDTGFWRSDNEYNYVEELERLRAAYPAFFSYYLESSSDKNSYVKKVHGQALDNNMERAERNGYVLYSLASSHTNTFQKRYERYLTAKCHV